MMRELFFDKQAIIVSLGALLAGFFIFFEDTNELFGSIAGALLLASLVYSSFIILRWIYLSTK